MTRSHSAAGNENGFSQSRGLFVTPQTAHAAECGQRRVRLGNSRRSDELAKVVHPAVAILLQFGAPAHRLASLSAARPAGRH
jgi:hypothetical protein